MAAPEPGASVPAADWQAFHDANSDWLDAELYNALAVVMAQWSQEYYLEGLSSCASACDAAILALFHLVCGGE